MEYYDTYNRYPMWMNYTQTKIPSPMNLRFDETTTVPPATVVVPLGGFAWPPRSYTCSFCKREFRSAQALGGHMNVHRRDRARVLNQTDPAAPVISSTTSGEAKSVETKLSVRQSCSVDEKVVKRYKVSGDHEIDLELRLGSDPQPVK